MPLKTFLLTILMSAQASFSASVFLSEIHYDNTGTDTGEFVEIYLASGLDIFDVSVQLYNGNGGVVYETISGADWTQGNTTILEGETFIIFSYSGATNSIQNGSPDGVAIGISGTLIEFISYEGTLTASDGIADGLTSTDIGVAETAMTPIGASLSLTNSGWQTTDINTQGVANDDLTINPIPEPTTTLLGSLAFLTLPRRKR